jgi:hypothetical protein
MPTARALGVAVLAATGITVYFVLWFRWPTFLAIAVGATLGLVMLLFATSLGPDPAEADAAWRAAAPDLAERERSSGSEHDLPPIEREPAEAPDPPTPPVPRQPAE